MIRLGVTGTDTGVGKTIVSCALARALARRGLSVAAMKPIETGVTFDDPSRDGVRLARAAGHEYLLNITAPLVMPDPVAPLVAARRINRKIKVSGLDRRIERSSARRNAIIVEGAGGLLVPVTVEHTYATLFRRWSLDVIIVAANKLGVINHVRLTCAACRAEGLSVHAIVLNHPSRIDAEDSSVSDNPAIIAELEEIPVIALPWLSDPYDVDRAASAVDLCGLPDLLLAASDN